MQFSYTKKRAILIWMSFWQLIWSGCAYDSLISTPRLCAQNGYQFQVWLRPQYTELLNDSEKRLDPSVCERVRSWGMAVGFDVGWGLAKRWAVWSGVAYSQQTQNYHSRSVLIDGSEQRVLRELAIEYIRFPLRIEYKPVVFERIQTQMGIGVFAAGLLGVSERDDDRRFRAWPPPYVHFSHYPPRSATFRAWHTGVLVHAGLAFKLRYNLWAVVDLHAEYALNDVEDKSAFFYWTENGSTERVAYYDSRHRAEFGDNRGPSRWLVLGSALGLRYQIVPRPKL